MANMFRRVVLAIAVSTAIVLSASASAETVVPELFRIPDNNVTQQMSSPLGENSQLVVLNEKALEANIISITLNGVPSLAVQETMEVRRNAESSGWVSRWTIGGATERSTITKSNGIVVATFRDGEGHKSYLRPGYGQTRELVELNPTPEELTRFTSKDDVEAVPHHLQVVANTLLPQVGQTGVWEAKVMAVYDRPSRDSKGGDALMAAFVQHEVDVVNTAYLNSGYTAGRLVLVHSEMWDWAGTSGNNSDTLTSLFTDPDIADRRNFYRADLVAAFVWNGAGRAFMPSQSYDPRFGFAVVSTLGAEIGKSTEHELGGHLFNAQHERAHAMPPPEQDPERVSYGFNNGETSDAVSYEGIREAYYSNPTLAWNGRPMGDALNDNVRAITESFPYVSQYYPDGVCVETPTSLCLLPVDGSIDGRFWVTVDWATTVTSGQGNKVPLTSDSGSFWFFGPSNLEMFVKVIDGRGSNNRFWVFTGALTNVEVDVWVTDTMTGAVWTRHNPYGSIPTFQDINAFTP